jgi:zinc protease
MLAVMAYDLLTSLGWEGVAHLWDRLGQLDAIAWRREVAPYLMAAPVATLYELPRGDAVSYQGLDPVPGAEAEGSEAMTRPRPVFEERMPRLEISEFGTETIYQDASDTLPSGLVIWVRSEPGLDLAGMHVLFRRRGALEPPGKEGVAELLHRIIGAGPAGMREGAFATRLADLGATLQVTDNPWLPFDDYYYSSRWGYLRVTSPPESLAAVTSELVAAICSPRADSVTIDRERSAIMAAVAREGRSAGKAAGRLLWEYLAEGDPRSRSPLGTPGSVARLGPTDVVDFALRYRAGDNLIVTVCTPLPARETLAHMRDAWVALPTESAFSAATPVAFSPGPRILEDSLGVGQGQLVMALTMPVAAQERPAAQLLAAILDRRMGLVLREQLGLAYSLGAQVSLEGRAGLIVASMGTRPERLPEGESRLRELVTQLVSDSFDDSVETIAAAMGMEQRGRLRNLTRVGRAFSMGMDLMNGEPPSAPGALAACRSVTADQLRAVAGRLNLNEAITVVVR